MKPSFPRAATEIHRKEFQGKLLCVEGCIPDGLLGHLFIVAPVGNHGDTEGEPRRNTLLNGDGMVYRVDFYPGSQLARVKSRLVKPPCFYADKVTRESKDWSTLAFRNCGIARMSLLGVRNFGNTALVPMPARDGTRLLVTYDVGRPIEIDPVTLETITPVGKNEEWMGEFSDRFAQPFKLVLTTAHPVWDMKTGHLFAVNYTRDISSILVGRTPTSQHPSKKNQRSSVKAASGADDTEKELKTRFIDGLEKLAERLQRAIPAANAFVRSLDQDASWLEAAQGTVSALWSLVALLARPLINESGLRLVRWDGHGGVESWSVVLPDGGPVHIANSMHQLAVTQDYIILADTSFKVALNQFYHQICQEPGFDRLLRLIHSRRALPDMPLYIIRRAHLEEARKDKSWKVTATPARLPYSAVHFLADYDNPGDRITLHVGHGSAVDIAEWVRPYDVLPWTQEPVKGYLSGMVTGAADVGRLGRYVIDGTTGKVLDARQLADADAMWTLALCTAHGVPAWDELPGRLDKLYWFSNGFWPELLTEFVFNLYAGADDRVMKVEEVRSVSERAPPSPCLFSVDTRTMTIVDRYHLERNLMMSSPQFVPHPSGAKDKGWIVALVVGEAEGRAVRQLWVFDADGLGRGPVAKLESPDFKFGFTLHTAWMPRIERSNASYHVDPKDDHGIDDALHDLKRLFAEEIFPAYIQQRSAAPDGLGAAEPGG
ncbi:carotenoid oxygenase family protein [Sorangium sp. So ce1335]|uniref:carotenoid oxygenase family protein n=1 Tax=Sorangium sp. So ce1335 TaxID=3133335 RepID=UPI003F604868